MSMQIADNFSYQGTKPLDARVKYATVADMAAVAASSLYDGIMAYVVATEKNYQWKSTNTVDPTLGKWREFQSGGSSGANNIVDGYRNPSDGLFYEEAAYTTAITGAANTLYVDLVTVGDAKDIYRWDGTGFVLENTRSQDIAYDDYQALSESEKNNGTTYYIPDATAASEMLVVGNRFDKANIYTATERMIGSYLGKPLYQRTFEFNNVSFSYGFYEIADATGCEYVNSWGNDGPEGIPQGYSNYGLFGAIYNSKFCIYSHAALTNQSGHMTFQYTKTTDGTIKIGTENDYSTDEMIIGSWIDGKPLYQKTVETNKSFVTTNPSWITEIADVSTLDIQKLLVVQPLTSIGHIANVFALHRIVNGYLDGYYTMSGVGTVTLSEVTIQYTKTTD